MICDVTLKSILDRQDRKCIDVDASVFYPRRRTRGALDYAKQFCDRCPIADHCRDYALNHDLDGIWGGTTEAERRAAS
jgi:WhiB family redox-sensing transcriptional regulator